MPANYLKIMGKKTGENSAAPIIAQQEQQQQNLEKIFEDI
jgi:hypothetical protein